MRRYEDIASMRRHVSTHISASFFPSNEWLALTGSQLCPDCSIVIVAISGRCNACKHSVPESTYNVPAPRARHLPELKQSHVDQLSLGAQQIILNAGLPHEQELFEVEKIIAKRWKNGIVEYLVVWKGYPGEDSWEEYPSLIDCKEAIDEIDNSLLHTLVIRKRVRSVAVGKQVAKDL